MAIRIPTPDIQGAQRLGGMQAQAADTPFQRLTMPDTTFNSRMLQQLGESGVQFANYLQEQQDERLLLELQAGVGDWERNLLFGEEVTGAPSGRGGILALEERDAFGLTHVEEGIGHQLGVEGQHDPDDLDHRGKGGVDQGGLVLRDGVEEGTDTGQAEHHAGRHQPGDGGLALQLPGEGIHRLIAPKTLLPSNRPRRPVQMLDNRVGNPLSRGLSGRGMARWQEGAEHGQHARQR